MADAVCVQVDPELFFPEKSGDHATAAKTVCNSCPVIEECLSYALTNFEVGVWGGTTTNQRKGMRARAGWGHGTVAGAEAHYRRGEMPCRHCRTAVRRAQ